MADKEATHEHQEYSGDIPHTTKRSQKIKRHYKRWWWAHLLALVIIVLVVTLPLIFVGYPRIAQDGIDKSGIHVSSQQILNPTPDAADIILQGQFLSNSSYHPQLDAFNASFYLDGSDRPFLTLPQPAIQGTNGTSFDLRDRINITDMAEFTKYCVTTLQQDEVVVYVRGRGGLKQGGLPHTNVNYNVRVPGRGLNGLQGLVVTSFSLKDNLPFNGNSLGNVTIPNPSTSTLALGNVSLNMYVNGTFVGNGTMPDLTIRPGNNSYTLYNTANQTTIATLLQKPQYKCGVLPIDVKGNASVFNGQVIPYFTTALQGNTQRTMLNLTDALNAAGFGFLINGTCET